MKLQHDDNFGADFVRLNGEDGELVALVVYRSDGSQRENVEAIVNACNAHDKLVAALKAIKEKHLLQYPHHEHLCAECQAANAALQAAGAA